MVNYKFFAISKKSERRSFKKNERKIKKSLKKLSIKNIETRLQESNNNLKIKDIIDFDQTACNSIELLAIKKNTTVKTITRFMKRKMLMFAKVSLMSFICNINDGSLFPTTEVLDIYRQNKIIKCLILLNLTGTDTCSILFVFVCNLASNISEADAGHLIFKIMLQSKS